ncbi:primosomal protein N' [Candidatus Saccharibacteria bacterium]|nr:primosomal protein N' [Candidatus Saccharibacteria bacterium]
MFYEVIPAKSIGQNSVGVLTYSSPENLQPGHIVLVPLLRAKVPGIVVKKVVQPDFKVKPIEKILYDTPLPPHLLKTIFWLSSYYLNSLPSAASTILPNGVEKARRKKPSEDNNLGAIKANTLPLNTAQKEALRRIEATSTATKLLYGITGSGKTNIYLKMTENTLRSGKSVILLVPEIALTSQLVEIFEQTFASSITLIHSRQTDATRHQIWEKLLQSTNPQIIIGPRSALFAPVKNLGLIIIDEAHESTFFQENSPKYSTTKLASFIASTIKITCLQGTATPLVTDYYLADKKQAVITLSVKAKNVAKAPDIHIVDLKDRTNFSSNRYFSTSLIKSIKANLEAHRQTLIFHNRRGSAPLTICEDCGWQALCPTCFLPLTLHSDTYRLICHTCGYSSPVPLNCPDCHRPGVIHKGFGTKLLEVEVKKLFPSARVARFDADNAKSETLDAMYTEVKNGEYDIIIGTQTLAKGLDLPLLATVGIAQADAGLNLPDFAAEEHTFELLTQVIGRVGRGHLDTAEVFIQTYQPEHPAIVYATKADYLSFYQHLLAVRRTAKLPPFTYLAKLSLTYKTEAVVLKNIKSLHKDLKAIKGLSVSTPTPAFHERSTKGYTWQLVLKSPSRKMLLSALSSLKKSPNLRITVDPPTLLTS